MAALRTRLDTERQFLTVAYHVGEALAEFRWPEGRWEQRFGAFTEGGARGRADAELGGVKLGRQAEACRRARCPGFISPAAARFTPHARTAHVGTARFWRLTGRDGERPEAFARHLEAGAGALAALERG